MTNTNLGITNTAETIQGFEPLPDGWYQVIIENVEEKPTKNDGARIIVTYTVIPGAAYAGRKIFASYSIKVPGSPEAEKIGRRMLGNIAYAVGLSSLSYADELINGRLSIRVETENDVNYGKRNIIGKNGYRTLAGEELRRPGQQTSVPGNSGDACTVPKKPESNATPW